MQQVLLVIYFICSSVYMCFPGGLDSKGFACSEGRPGIDPWIGNIPCRRKWQPTLVFLPGESHGQWSLTGYSPCCRRRAGHDLAMEQQTSNNTSQWYHDSVFILGNRSNTHSTQLLFLPLLLTPDSSSTARVSFLPHQGLCTSRFHYTVGRKDKMYLNLLGVLPTSLI